MRKKMFGVDIAKEIYSATRNQLRPATLRSRVDGDRDEDDMASGTETTYTSHTAEGFRATKVVGRQADNTAITEEVVTLITDSISPSVIPKYGDLVSVDGATEREVIDVKVDPVDAAYILTVA